MDFTKTIDPKYPAALRILAKQTLMQKVLLQ